MPQVHNKSDQKAWNEAYVNKYASAYSAYIKQNEAEESAKQQAAAEKDTSVEMAATLPAEAVAAAAPSPVAVPAAAAAPSPAAAKTITPSFLEAVKPASPVLKHVPDVASVAAKEK